MMKLSHVNHPTKPEDSPRIITPTHGLYDMETFMKFSSRKFITSHPVDVMNKHTAIAQLMTDHWATYTIVDPRTGETIEVTFEQYEKLLYEEEKELFEQL